MRAFNFGPKFCKWIEIIYNSPECAVTNNGYSSEFFTLSRGIRQGCPISALLFILVAEVMAINLREDDGIKPLDINGVTLKLSQYADDTTLFIHDIHSLENAFVNLRGFSTCSGLRLNMDKTEAIQLGIDRHNNQHRKLGIKWVDDHTRVLGVWVGKDVHATFHKNTAERLQKVKNLLNMYKARNLTIKGRITILKSLAIPRLLFALSVLPNDDAFIAEVEHVFYDFIWPNGKHHVKKNTLIQPIEDGGLKMPDFKDFLISNKLCWIGRILNEKSIIHKIASAVTDIGNLSDFLSKKFDVSYTNRLPIFYQQIFGYWSSVYGTEPSDVNGVLNECLWHNKWVLIDQKPFYYRYLAEKGINIVADLIDEHGSLLSLEQLEYRYQVSIKIMDYNSITTAIPRSWRRLLRSIVHNQFNRYDELYVNICGKLRPLHTLKSRDFYLNMIRARFCPPACINRWQECYADHIFDWDSIFTCAFKCARETELHSFQYRMIHRYIPCNRNLYKWKKSNTELCSSCQEIDTIEHYLVLCQGLHTFWQSFHDWWIQVYNVNIRLSTLDILFGVCNNEQDVVINALNFCLLYARYYIYKCKIKDADVEFAHFKQKLRNRLRYEECILIQSNKYDDYVAKWHVLSTAL